MSLYFLMEIPTKNRNAAFSFKSVRPLVKLAQTNTLTRCAAALMVTIFFSSVLSAQSCTTPGQTPSTAFPVCGTTTFHQTNVPICVTHNLYVPNCTGAAYADKNPFWYQFTCYQTGTLGFLIKPNDAGDDYDWQLYDITGHLPDDVFTDHSLVVTGNWAGTFGSTGTSSSGVNFIQCASDPSQNLNSFAAMPTLQVGHTYLLLVSHFTDSQSGYSLSFGGGTAVITDPTVPRLKKGDANCEGNLIRVKLSKNIFCNTISSNGSEFYLTPSAATVISSTGIGCSSKFDTDSLEIHFSTSLTPGNYTLHIKKGDDNNTLLDYCDNAVPQTDSIPFVILAKYPTPMDSLVPPACAPSQLKLVFKQPIQCTSIAPDGSDFTVTGSYPVSINSASGNCVGGLSKEITITLSKPLQDGGNFVLVLKTGSDGNTLLNECGEQTATRSSLPFSVKDTVDARFTYTINYGCMKDTVHYNHAGGNGVNTWSWLLDEGQQSSQQSPTGYYSNFSQKTVRLAVSNSFCTDTSLQKVALLNFLKADFSISHADNCPNDLIAFTDHSIGSGLHYHWEFGDGATSDSANPHHAYSGPVQQTAYPVRLTITDTFGCQQTALHKVNIFSSCFIAVPNAFTPNNDGRNDFFHVLNAVKAEEFELLVYNRWGQLVFKTTNWKEGWDGNVNGQPQGSAVYVWMLRYTDRDTQRKVAQKGTVVLIR